jgi:hypothetical protein
MGPNAMDSHKHLCQLFITDRSANKEDIHVPLVGFVDVCVILTEAQLRENGEVADSPTV